MLHSFVLNLLKNENFWTVSKWLGCKVSVFQIYIKNVFLKKYLNIFFFHEGNQVSWLLVVTVVVELTCRCLSLKMFVHHRGFFFLCFLIQQSSTTLYSELIETDFKKQCPISCLYIKNSGPSKTNQWECIIIVFIYISVLIYLKNQKLGVQNSSFN